MIDRRSFLTGLLALAGGQVVRAADNPATSPLEEDAFRQYFADLGECEWKVLGSPRRRSLIEEGHLPVAPDRVVVVEEAELRRFRDIHPRLRRRLRAEAGRWQGLWRETPPSSAKLDVCVGVMDRLTAFYRRPDLFGRWSRTLWRRELLGSTGVGQGLGLLHDFQSCDTAVRTANGVVDWWLVLLPGGVEWQALDGRPVYYLVGPVMEERRPGSYLRVMEGIFRALRPVGTAEGFDPAGWAGRLAGLPAADAARAFNFAVTAGLRGRG